MCSQKATKSKTSKAHWKSRRPGKTMEERGFLSSTIFKNLNSLNSIQQLSAGSDTDSQESKADDDDDDDDQVDT